MENNHSSPPACLVDQLGVHATHCCPRHGCKYSYGQPKKEQECPVAQGTVLPCYPENNGCERCEMECEERGLPLELIQRIDALLAQPEMQGQDFPSFMRDAVQRAEQWVRDTRALESAEALAEEELRLSEHRASRA